MKNNKNPRVRVKGFAGSWEQNPLNCYLEPSDEKNYDGTFSKEDVLSVSGDYGIVNQIEFKGRSFAGESVLNYGVVHTGDVVYTKSPLKETPYGIIKANLGKPGIVSTLYAVYHVKEHNYPEFIQLYFENNDRLNRYLAPLVNKGAKNDMKISSENTLLGNVIFPEFHEQKEIAEYLSKIKKIILQQEAKLKAFQALKSAMLEKMFPKAGADVPEVRFAEFTGEWKQNKISTLGKFSKGYGYSKSDLVSAGTPIVLYGRLYTNYQFVISEVDTYAVIKNNSVMSTGNEVIVPASGETPEDIARASAIKNEGVILGGDLNIVTPYSSITPEFLALSISNGHSQKMLSQKAQGKSVVHIHNSDIADIVISYPTHEEQVKISDFFQKLDRLIIGRQKMIRKLQHLKKALLERMFV